LIWTNCKYNKKQSHWFLTLFLIWVNPMQVVIMHLYAHYVYILYCEHHVCVYMCVCVYVCVCVCACARVCVCERETESHDQLQIQRASHLIRCIECINLQSRNYTGLKEWVTVSNKRIENYYAPVKKQNHEAKVLLHALAIYW